ncbi:Mrp/NBP35 family ATP-binding protein [Sphingomonas abietis]|uniref:Iron-sulfur cluster carrier protein n=1 Tax=Sphingomonas abietis TaxID=3012344 RepID=A0ABY7NNK4_9SPHN|nr:Mrp/NBP35 family ATP-binding protein [Sphingomonas abietis]WBO23119.1 Mrp/NBP35 family ATP-binding protein [Sphingomonas abietis]
MTDSALLAAALATLPDAARVAPPRISGDGVASVILDVSGMDAQQRDALEAEVRRLLLAVAGVREVRVVQTAEKPERRLIAVGSGKGGVGKSTLSANLAIALHRLGFRVGLVDADVYGPSQPRLMAAEGEKPTAQDKQLNPIPTRWGVPMLSMGQLVAPEKALAWRGPMASGALGQLVDARWGETDTLVVDLPPGTGDVQLSMIQKHRPMGAVIVSTPQDLALIDAARAIDLFNTAGIPIIGIVENMAGYACPHCGEISDPFGSGGAEAEAARLGIPFLGRVPLDIAIRRASDAGEPPAARDDAGAEPFLRIAEQVAAAIRSR